MFNKKLKRRVKSLEEELGYVWSDGYHEDLAGGALYQLQRKIEGLLNFLKIKNDGTNYPHYNFVKREDSNAE